MKNFKNILIGLGLATALTSCKKWLDVNVDQDNPNNKSVLLENRLPWIQRAHMYSAGVTNFRSSAVAGVYYSNSTTATNTPNSVTTTWSPVAGLTTTPYQTWFVGVGSNVTDMYNTAKAKGAYHYMAAANVFHALGFMQMLDLYGEMPYTEALSGNASPKHDKGRTIYYGSIAKLNEAIALFGRAQEANAPSFAAGDMMGKGNLDKWIKMCWGLKARYMLKLSKKSDLFNADSVLYFLSKGPQSNADNMVIEGLNNSTVTDPLFGDPIVTNGNYDYAAYGSNTRISHFYYDLLTNTRGAGVVDPRMSKIVPAMMTSVKLGTDGRVSSFKWTRSIGVDSYGAATRLLLGATSIALPTYADTDKELEYNFSTEALRDSFVASLPAGRIYTLVGEKGVKIKYLKGSMYISATSIYQAAGDTVYVNLRSNSAATAGTVPQPATDVNWYASAAAYTAGVVGSTGSFQTRPVSDFEVLTYHEMCFIAAETYLRKGDAGNAHVSYKKGIEAHINMMQSKLTAWQATYGTTNPDMRPMNQSDITAYLASAAVVQNSGSLTMKDIMLQKYIAMGCSVENWNDMRRFNFSAGNVGSFGTVYPGYDRGPMFTGAAALPGSSKSDPKYWMRRFRLPANLELAYNTNNVLALNKHANQLYIWSLPVWWDCATDEEYDNYLK